MLWKNVYCRLIHNHGKILWIVLLCTLVICMYFGMYFIIDDFGFRISIYVLICDIIQFSRLIMQIKLMTVATKEYQQLHWQLSSFIRTCIFFWCSIIFLKRNYVNIFIFSKFELAQFSNYVLEPSRNFVVFVKLPKICTYIYYILNPLN